MLFPSLASLAIACGGSLVDPASVEPKSATTPVTVAADVSPPQSRVGEVTGVVTKVSGSSITVKVPEVVQTGTTHKRVHVPGQAHRSVTATAPKTAVKQVEVTYAIGDKVTVVTVTGKPALLADVVVGETVRLRVNKVTVKAGDGKADAHLEVARIDVPNTPVAVKK